MDYYTIFADNYSNRTLDIYSNHALKDYSNRTLVVYKDRTIAGNRVPRYKTIKVDDRTKQKVSRVS